MNIECSRIITHINSGSGLSQVWFKPLDPTFSETNEENKLNFSATELSFLNE